MSSDPIEVLRQLAAMFESLEADYRAKIKGRDAADPMTNFNLGIAEGYERASKAAQSALASLSAPKPESAEAVAWLVESGDYRHAFLAQASAAAQAHELRRQGYDYSLAPLYTAPPRPEASEVEKTAVAWWGQVCDALSEADPAWMLDGPGGIESAVAMIRKLAAPQQASEERCRACGLPPIAAGKPPLETCACARLTYTAPQQASAPVGVDAKWPDDYCPECGSSKVHHREGEHIQCGNCHQEYFTSIDYSGVVRENLKRLFALAQQTAAVAPVGVPVDVVREYLDARACYEEATRPPNSHAPAPALKHGDPVVLRLREARVALDNAIGHAQQPSAKPKVRVELIGKDAVKHQQPAAVDEATRRDAERYRFLAGEHSLKWEEELDAAIDQARGKGGAGK